MFISTYLHQHNALIATEKMPAAILYSSTKQYTTHAFNLIWGLLMNLCTIQKYTLERDEYWRGKRRRKCSLLVETNEDPNYFHEIELDYVHLSNMFTLFSTQKNHYFAEKTKPFLLLDYKIAINFVCSELRAHCYLVTLLLFSLFKFVQQQQKNCLQTKQMILHLTRCKQNS